MKRILAGCWLLLAMLAAQGADVCYRTEFKDWNGAGKTVTAEYAGFASAEKGLTITAKLPDVEVKKDRFLRFDWQYKSKAAVNYIAFSFLFQGEQKSPAYLFFDGANAAKPSQGFEPEVWHSVDVPLTALQVHGGKELAVGDKLTGLNFWIALNKDAAGDNSLLLRNFEIVERSESERTAHRDAALATQPFRVWPRQTPVCWPTELSQFVFVELPNPSQDKEFTLTVTLPENCRITAFPKGAPPALPAGADSVYPLSSKLQGNTGVLTLDGKAFGDAPYKFLTLTVDVAAAPGEAKLGFRYALDGRELRTAELPVKIYPALRAAKLPEGVTVAAYAYPGLDKPFMPTFLGMFRAAGVNAMYNMRGEKPGVHTLSDLAREYDMNVGLVFFIHQIQEMYKKAPMAGAVEADSLEKLLAHPDDFKKMIKGFLDANIGGKPYSCFIYDAEAGGLRRGKITGDTSPFALESFRKWAKIPADQPLTVEEIRTKYAQQWVDFICDQSNRFSRLFREVLDDHYPEFRYEAYSGYELDDGPLKNRTRELYGTDWKTMSDTGIEYATAGYHGSMAQLRHTRDAVKGKALYLPAEAYVENFLTKLIANRRPEEWGSRLVQAYMNGSRHGLTLWYANDMDGGALIAVDHLTHFISLLGDFATKGKDDPEAVSVRPVSESDNVYVLRRGGNAVIVCLNDSDAEKTMRITLKAFRVSGFTGEMSVTDLADGKELKASKVLTVKVPAYGYRMLQLMDDGN